ncbi:S8 family serine peptidase [Meiothermus sp.]|uniref:S8 family peptidase n=1 Tax=Meiothermus sp. TaxID=1955249 RepID=UPI0021DE6B62|nr:S8 family serine peptidase [Meiothermus sp.]GIW25904.1 MAG: hypothetical protein KatS3mg069_2171 [Meiothermus sp.]
MPEKRPFIHIWLYRALALALLALLAACGGPNRPTALPPSDQGYLLTVPTTRSDTPERLAQRYGGEVIAWLEDKAILKLSSQAAAALQGSGVSLQNTTLTADSTTSTPEYAANGWNSWAGGWNSWAGGWNSWAGGWNSWAGGTGTIPALPSDNRQKFMLTKLPQGQALGRNFGQGIKVAVIDTGIDLNHPMFQGRLAPSGEWLDEIGKDPIPQEESGTMYGHGTAVAGLILQVAPRATILPIRALAADGSGSVSNLIAAISHAIDMGAHIINLSLGTTDNGSPLRNLIDSAVSRGIYVVASSGNTGDLTPHYPAAWASGNRYILSVGSVSVAGTLSSFTSYGTNLEILAPGEAMVSAYPNSQIGSFTGTSFAAPQISGNLALLMSDTAGANWGNLESYLLLSATPDANGDHKIANAAAAFQRLPDFRRKNALFVAGSTKPNGSDNALINRLTGLGYTVTVRDSKATASDAAGKDLILISATASTLGGAVFRNVTVPVVVWRPDIYDDMGMTGLTTDQFGSSTGQNQGTLTSTIHPMGAGLASGNYGMYTTTDVVSWGVPSAAASVIATQPGTARALIFGYETGAPMVGLTAPSRRVGFFLNTNQGGKLTSTGWNLFEAAITWAASGN